MGRSLQSQPGTLRTNLDSIVYVAQGKQKQHYDEQSKSHDFRPGNHDWTRDFWNNSVKWISGVVLQSVSIVSYMIQLYDGTLWKRYVDHIYQMS